MEVVSAIIVFILAVIGIVEIVRKAVFHLFRIQNDGKYIVVAVPADAESCENLVRSCAEKIQWMESNKDSSLICFNSSGSEEIDQICNKLKRTYPYLSISKSGELENNMIELVSNNKGE